MDFSEIKLSLRVIEAEFQRISVKFFKEVGNDKTEPKAAILKNCRVSHGSVSSTPLSEVDVHTLPSSENKTGATVTFRTTAVSDQIVGMVFSTEELANGDLMVLEVDFGSTKIEEITVFVDGKPHVTHNSVKMTTNPMALVLT